MDIYVLDSRLRRSQCVDLYNSFIWSERYSEKGDFVLVMDVENPSKAHFEKGTKIAIKNSFKIMTVDTIHRTVDDNGAEVYKITGYSDESIFEGRVAKRNLQNLELNPNWEINGIPRDIMKKMVYDICITGVLSTKDKVPYLKSGDLINAPGTWVTLPPLLVWNDAEGVWETAYSSGVPGDSGSEPIIVNSKPQSLYATIKEICDVYGLGFRLVRNYDKSELYFEIYTGQDRTSTQTYYDPVRFSMELGNLVSSAEIDTNKDTYNVAYVFSKRGFQSVDSPYANPAMLSGFTRRVLFVEVTEYEEEQPIEEHNRLLRQRGLEELAKHVPTNAFDGEITQVNQYTYGVDYELGDLVEIRRSDGMFARMRVTEQIFVSDLEGDRAYPTFTSFDTISPLTWAGQPVDLYWSQAEGYWIDWS